MSLKVYNETMYTHCGSFASNSEQVANYNLPHAQIN